MSTYEEATAIVGQHLAWPDVNFTTLDKQYYTNKHTLVNFSGCVNCYETELKPNLHTLYTSNLDQIWGHFTRKSP